MSIAELTARIRECEAKNDFMGIVRLRAQIARDFPNTPEAAEALFRLGLYFLFAQNDVPSAMQTLEDAIKTKDPHWSKAARVSLASLYLREQKPQKALLELRKAVNEKEPPSIHTVSALSIMEAVLEEQGNHAAAEKAKQDKLQHLAALADDARTKGEHGALAFYLVSLGQELLRIRQADAAKKTFDEVIALGPEKAGQQTFTQAQTLLKTI